MERSDVVDTLSIMYDQVLAISDILYKIELHGYIGIYSTKENRVLFTPAYTRIEIHNQITRPFFLFRV